jgi:hypothetical protein
MALIFTMSSGAMCLRWLQPAPAGQVRAALLAAEYGPSEPISEVTIEYVAPERGVDLSQYDCVISPEGVVDWRPQSHRIHVLLLGAGGQRLPRACSQALLQTLGNMTSAAWSAQMRVELAPNSDPRRAANLPPEAHDLLELLIRKAIIR